MLAPACARVRCEECARDTPHLNGACLTCGKSAISRVAVKQCTCGCVLPDMADVNVCNACGRSLCRTVLSRFIRLKAEGFSLHAAGMDRAIAVYSNSARFGKALDADIVDPFPSPGGRARHLLSPPASPAAFPV
jgi:hypothetical protein